jgi:hypothetical protein
MGGGAVVAGEVVLVGEACRVADFGEDPACDHGSDTEDPDRRGAGGGDGVGDLGADGLDAPVEGAHVTEVVHGELTADAARFARGRSRASTTAALVAVRSRRTPPGVSSARRRCSRQTAWVRNATSSSRRSDRSRRVTVASSRATSWSPLASRAASPIDTASSRSVFLPCPRENTALEPPAWRARPAPARRRRRDAAPGTGPRHGNPPPPTGGASSEPRTVSVRGNPPWCSRTSPRQLRFASLGPAPPTCCWPCVGRR